MYYLSADKTRVARRYASSGRFEMFSCYPTTCGNTHEGVWVMLDPVGGELVGFDTCSDGILEVMEKGIFFNGLLSQAVEVCYFSRLCVNL